jgi:hypothetical protein
MNWTSDGKTQILVFITVTFHCNIFIPLNLYRLDSLRTEINFLCFKHTQKLYLSVHFGGKSHEKLLQESEQEI